MFAQNVDILVLQDLCHQFINHFYIFNIVQLKQFCQIHEKLFHSVSEFLITLITEIFEERFLASKESADCILSYLNTIVFDLLLNHLVDFIVLGLRSDDTPELEVLVQ